MNEKQISEYEEIQLLKYKDEIEKNRKCYYIGKVKLKQKDYFVAYDENQDQVLICKFIGNKLSATKDRKIYKKIDYSDYFVDEILSLIPRYKVRNPFNTKKYTSSLNEEEYNILKEALEKNKYLTDEQKEFIICYKDLLLGTRINLEKLYNRYIDLKMPKFESKNYQGLYCPSSNASCLNLGNNDEEQILVAIHENLHLHQTNLCGEFLFVPFVEGMTELTAEEYCQKLGISINLNIYQIEQGICRCLCEIFDENKIKEIFLLGDYEEFKKYFISVMGEGYFYSVFTRMGLIFNSDYYNGISVADLIYEILSLLNDIAVSKEYKEFEVYNYFNNEEKVRKNYIIKDNEYKAFEKVLKRRK